MTRYKQAYSKCMFCGIWPVFANPVTFFIPTLGRTYNCSVLLCTVYIDIFAVIACIRENNNGEKLSVSGLRMRHAMYIKN